MKLKIHNAIVADRKWVRMRIISNSLLSILLGFSITYACARLSGSWGENSHTILLVICCALWLLMFTRGMTYAVSAIGSSILVCVDGTVCVRFVRERFVMQFDAAPSPDDITLDNTFWRIEDSKGNSIEVPVGAFPELNLRLPQYIEKALANPGDYREYNV